MIDEKQLAEWKELAEAALPVRLGERPIYLEAEDGRHVAAVGLVAGPHVGDLHLAALFAAARPAILALVAEVERLQKDGDRKLRGLILSQIPYISSTAKEMLTVCTAEECVESAAREILELRDEIEDARAAVGEGWFSGGATLAEAIERKCRMLEGDAAKSAAELERFRRDNEMTCENTPWPGCECPGCETARERAEEET